MEECVSAHSSTEIVNKEEQNVDVTEVDDEYKISLKDVLIIVLTGLCLPTWDVASDVILASTLIYPQYCFEYSWQEYANKFGYDQIECMHIIAIPVIKHLQFTFGISFYLIIYF